jgi:hypothetical protein
MSDDDYKPKNALKFQTFEDCMTEEPKDWLIEGVIALDEDSSWFGPPGSLKSALLTDIMVHAASGRDWRGHKFNRDENSEPEDARSAEYRGVVYFALERASLTRRRLAAYAARDGLPPDLPIAVVSDTIDLLDPACVGIVADAIARFEDEANCIVGLVICDTFSKAVAAGGGDEDKAQTQNIAASNLKKIREASCGRFHIATIGHTGKKAAAGERGSNAKLGHVDLAVQISGDKVRTATIVKGNDQPEGALALFEMEEITVIQSGAIFPGRGPGGGDLVFEPKPWTVAILAAATPAKEARLVQALDALKRAIAARGQDGAVNPDCWKEELARAGLIKADDKNPRATFKRIRDGIAQQIFVEPNGLVRIIPQPGNIPECPA